MAQQTLDARGLNCPLPLLRTRKSLAQLEPGEKLLVLATDSATTKDLQAFVKQTGHLLLQTSEINGEYHFLLQKKTV